MKKNLFYFIILTKNSQYNREKLRNLKKIILKLFFIIIFHEYKSLNYNYNNKILKKIKYDYEKLNITLNLDKIYKINNF